MADKNSKPPNPLLRHGIYFLPNLFTSAALFAGFYAIVQAMNANFDDAAIAIFIAMVMDSLDGRVARLTNTQSAFGAQYDSLSDMVSFGVAPALVIYVWALKPLHKLGWMAAFIYCACVALRLARFNTQHGEDDEKYYFRGLPSPAAAALLAGLVWVAQEYDLNGQATLGLIKMKWLAWCMTVFASVSMVNDVRYYSGKDINFKNSVPFVVILGVVLVLVLIAYSPPEVLFLFAVLYALSGYARLMWKKAKRK